MCISVHPSKYTEMKNIQKSNIQFKSSCDYVAAMEFSGISKLISVTVVELVYLGWSRH